MRRSKATEWWVRGLSHKLSLCFTSLLLATPTIASALTPTELLSVADIESISASADGHHLSFVVVRQDLDCNCYRQSWFVWDDTDGKVKLADVSSEAALMYVGDGRITSGYVIPRTLWSPDGTRFLYIKVTNHQARLFVYDTRTEHASEVATQGDNVYAAAWGNTSGDIDYVIAEADAEETRWWQNGLLSGYLYDRSFRPYYQHEPLHPQHLAPEYPLHQKFMHPQPAGRRLNLSTQEDTAISANDVLHRTNVSIELWGNWNAEQVTSPDGAIVAHLRSKPDYPFQATTGVEITRNGTPVSCPNICNGAVTNVTWNRARGTLVFSTDPEDRSQPIVFFEFVASTGKFIRIASVPRRLGSSQDQCAVAAHYLVCDYEDATIPPKVVRIDLSSRRQEDLFDPNAEVRRDITVVAKPFSFTDDHGNSLAGRIVFPKNFRRNQRYPLVITGYVGNGFARGGAGDEYPIIPFAEAGMLVLDYYAPAPWHLPQGPGRQFEGTAIESKLIQGEVNRLLQEGAVDNSRIAITGLSGASDLVNYELINGLPKAAAITSGGTFDPIQYFLMGPDLQTIYWPKEGYANPDLTQDMRVWKRWSVALNAERIHTPLLINAASTEYMGNLETWSALTGVGTPIEMYVYSDEYHVKVQPVHRLSIYNRNLDWLRYWLEGYEDPVPAKREQYGRWENFRVKRDALLRAPAF